MAELLFGLFLGAVVSGVVPLVNAELLVVGAAAMASATMVPAIALVSAIGQMIAKTGLFAAARWAPSRLPAAARTRLNKAAGAVSNHGGAAGSLVFTSAVIGLPPFYGVSLAVGALGMRLRTFVVAGLAGRLIRFGVLAWAGARFGAGALHLIAGRFNFTTLLGG